MSIKRILHVTSVLNFGGIETLIMNIFRNIDREKIVFDFLVVREDNGFFEEEIKALGGRIYKIPALKKVGYFKFKKELDYFFKSHSEYDIVHSHINALSGIILESAKRHNVKTRIAHSHTAFPKYSFAEKVIKNHFKKSIIKNATDFFACSKNASEWLFGEKAQSSIIIKNGIDTKIFSFSPKQRELCRNDLNIDDKFVIINIGRFSKEKNHSFLISVFDEVLKINPDAFLICIGNGHLKGKAKDLIHKLNLDEKVLLLESTENVARFLNAADVYVSTSIFEGFGTSVAEAQFNSLSCVLSDIHSIEVDLFGKCNFLSLKETAENWARTISNTKRGTEIPQKTISLCENNINYTVKTLTDYYLGK